MQTAQKDWRGNANSIYKTLGATNHTEKERETNDYYATDPLAIDKLLSVEQLSQNIWECACGEGHLSKRLSEKGYSVWSTDIVDRGYENFNGEQDFLTSTKEPFKGDCDIVTNPPYKFAKDFVLKALSQLSDGHKACFFLKLTFLEGKDRYLNLFSEHPPKSIYIFSERIMCAKNGDFEQMKKGGGSAVAYAWYTWEKGFKGSPTVAWI